MKSLLATAALASRIPPTAPAPLRCSCCRPRRRSRPCGCGVNPAGSLTVLGGAPALGQMLTLGLDDPAHTLQLPAAAYLLVSLHPDAHFPG